jgi:hypothetical protein
VAAAAILLPGAAPSHFSLIRLIGRNSFMPGMTV